MDEQKLFLHISSPPQNCNVFPTTRPPQRCHQPPPSPSQNKKPFYFFNRLPSLIAIIFIFIILFLPSLLKEEHIIHSFAKQNTTSAYSPLPPDFFSLCAQICYRCNELNMCNEMHFTIFLVFFVECGKLAHTHQLVQRQFKNRKKISHETSTKTNARLFFSLHHAHIGS
jgi:hypothetical protein